MSVASVRVGSVSLVGGGLGKFGSVWGASVRYCFNW